MPSNLDVGLMVWQAENRALKSTFCIMRPDLLSAYAQELAATQGMPTPGFWKVPTTSLHALAWTIVLSVHLCWHYSSSLLHMSDMQCHYIILSIN